EEILETTDKIEGPLQLIVVAGKNESLKHELENRTYNQKHNVKVLGFCTNIHELMECSHLLISKAGGLTMTEAVIKKLPVLVFDPIPGQEMKNAQYFSNIGAAMYLKNLEEVKNAIDELLYKRPKKRQEMIGCCSMICKPYAAEEVSDFILGKINNMVYEKTPQKV
ncbi:MAG TPA: glycosyltransferase, partial [Clostridia bacterium]|nr:glycosyltransferase [Clostridia bacterium]